MSRVRQAIDELKTALATESIPRAEYEGLIPDMTELARTLNARSRALAKASLRRGMRVRFTTRDGRVVTGTVTKVNRKTANVQPDEDYRSWRVAMQLLEIV